MKVAGSCSYGCGMPMAPQPPLFWTLPARVRDDVTVIEDVVEQVVVVETCDRPIAAP